MNRIRIYPKIYQSFSKDERTVIDSVIDQLYRIDKTIGLIWGGSSTLANPKPRWSDLDFWLIVDDPSSTKKKLHANFKKLKHLTFVHDGGYLPWLGEFLSLFFFQGCLFSIDVGITKVADLDKLNVGPKPFLLWGDPSQLLTRLKHQKYRLKTEIRLENILINVLKIRKCLAQNYLWNAIEYLSRARSHLIGIIVNYPEQDLIFYTRAERKIEDYLNREQLTRLSKTCPNYSKSDIAKCTSILIEECLTSLQAQGFLWPLSEELETQHQWLLRLLNNKGT